MDASETSNILKFLDEIVAFADRLIPSIAHDARALGGAFEDIISGFVSAAIYLVVLLIIQYWRLVLTAICLVVAFTSPFWLYSWKKNEAISFSVCELGFGLCALTAGLVGLFTTVGFVQSIIAVVGGGYTGLRGLNNLAEARKRPDTTPTWSDLGTKPPTV